MTRPSRLSTPENRERWAAEARDRRRGPAGDRIRAIRREYARRNRPKLSAARKEIDRRVKLKARFGLTVEQYDALLAAQDGVCAICKHVCATGARLAVDHHHTTCRVRGLLCARCNTNLAVLEQPDWLTWLDAAIAYLETSVNGSGSHFVAKTRVRARRRRIGTPNNAPAVGRSML